MNPFPPISQIKPYFERYNDDMVEEHLKTNQPMIPNDVQTLIDEPEEPLLVTEEQQQQEEMSGMGGTHVVDDFDLAFDQAFDNQGFQQQQQQSSAFGVITMNETAAIPSTVVGAGQQQQGFFGFQ